MSKILIQLNDETQYDPKTAWRVGDIYSVKDDDFVFGSEECEPTFRVVHIEDVPPGQLKQFVGSWNNADGTHYRNSLWRWDLDKSCFVRKSDGLERHPKDLKDNNGNNNNKKVK